MSDHSLVIAKAKLILKHPQRRKRQAPDKKFNVSSLQCDGNTVSIYIGRRVQQAIKPTVTIDNTVLQLI